MVVPVKILFMGEIELFNHLTECKQIILLVGRMDQNMNLKEKWVYEEKASSYKNGYKSYIIHICKPDLALNNP